MSGWASEYEEKLLEDLKTLELTEQNLLNQILTAINSLYQVSTRRTNKTLNVEVDLSVSHSDEPLNLEVSGRVYRWLTIEKCDQEDVLTYKLKQTDGTFSDVFRAAQGRSINQHDFLDILVSNSPSTGTCRFVVGYWE